MAFTRATSSCCSRMSYTAISTLALAVSVFGHGAMTFPRPRNALDGQLDNWDRWAYPCDDAHSGDNCRITFCENGKNCEG